MPSSPTPVDRTRSWPMRRARLVPPPLVIDAEGTPIVDVRGPRFGATVTTAVLATAMIVQGSVGLALLIWQWAAFALSAIAGLAWSPYGRVFRALKRRFDLGAPPATEPEAGPRFAQACGLTVTSVALALHLVGATTAGWIAAGTVLALSALLAGTGWCVGCEVFVVAQRVRARFGKAGAGVDADRPPRTHRSSRADRLPRADRPPRADRAERGRRGQDVEVAPEQLAVVGLALDGADVGALLFSGGGCTACAQVKAQLDDLCPQLAASGRRLRWAEVDAATHLDLAQRLRVLRVPTLVVLDLRGRVVARSSGAPRPEALRAMLDDALGAPVV